MHVEGIVLPPFQTDIHAQVTPGLLLGCHVVRHLQGKVVDDAHLLEAGTVLVALHLHLDVVGKAERQVAGLAACGETEGRALVRRILDKVYATVGIGALVGLVIAVARRTEVWGVAEADLWGEDVADGLYLVTENLAAGHIETIQLGAGAHGEVPVVDVVQSVDGIVDHGAGGFVPRLVDLTQVGTVGEVERRGDVYIIK